MVAAKQEITEEATSRYVDTPNCRVHLNEAGTGPALVCLHGGGPGSSGWGNFSRNIGPLSEDFHVLLIDQPQFGKSDIIPIPDPEFPARVIKDVLDALNIETASFIGNSMGGINTLHFALAYPERVEKLILMTEANMVSYFQALPTEGMRRLFVAMENPTRETLRDLMQTFVYDPAAIPDALLDKRVEDASRPGIKEARAKSVRITNMDFVPRLKEVSQPTLVIQGRDDRVIHFDAFLPFLWHMPNVEVHLFDKCGHWVQFEKPEKFNRLVKSFLLDE